MFLLPPALLHVIAAVYFAARLLVATPFLSPQTTLSAFLLRLTLLFLPILPLISFLSYSLSSLPPFLSSLFAILVAIHFSFLQRSPFPSSPLLSAYPILLSRVDVLLYLDIVLLSIFSHAQSLLSTVYIFTLLALSNLFFLAALISRADSCNPLTLIRTAFTPHLSSSELPPAVPPNASQLSALSLLYFSWVTPVVVTGRARPLEPVDVPVMTSAYAADVAAEHHLSPHWTNECSRPHPSLLRALFKAFGLRLSLAGVFKIFNDALLFVPPILLRSITRFLQHREKQHLSSSYGALLAVFLFVSYVLQSLLFNHYFNINCTVQALLRGALVSTLYKKSCRLSPESRAAYTSGQIQNLMSNDSRAVSDVVLYIHMLWSSVFQVVIAVALLVGLLGWLPTLAGIGCILASMPLQARLVGIVKRLRERASAQTDERVKAVSEAVRGIKLVKLYAWELSFVRRILSLRALELNLLRGMTVVQAWSSLFASGLPTMLTVVVFVTYVLQGFALDAAIVFPAVALFNVIRPGLLIFPNMLVQAARAAASVSRLRAFLLAEELQPLSEGPHAVDQELMRRAEFDAAAINASFSWDPSSSSTPTLANISFQIPRGALVAIVGPTGAGKSTLLTSLLGEVPILSGRAGLRQGRSVAFCDQIPFIQNATVRDNILFGRAFDEKHYNATISACCLEPDLQLLPGGDLTEIGGRGVNLSGGQRARVSLARAVYSRSDIVMLDDPLSAVDAHVGKTMFNECLVKQLDTKTRLLTTNQIHFAASPAVDMIIVVKDGGVSEFGPRAKLVSNPDSEFSQLLESAGELGAGEVSPSGGENGHGVNGTHDENSSSQNGDHIEAIAPVENDAVSVTQSKKDENAPAGNIATTNYGTMEAGKLVEKEQKNKGRVKWRHYKSYFSAMGFLRWAVPIITASFVSQCFILSVSVWLSIWSDASGPESSGDSLTVVQRLAVFLVLGFCAILCNGASGFFLAFGSIEASMRIHEKFLLSVMGSTSSFFNSTPQGRIVNRFNSDIDKVDSALSGNLQSLSRLLLSLGFILALNLWAVPLLIVVVIPITAMCVYIQEFYRKTSVDLQRLQSLARSPLYSHFAETLDGVMTIRAYDDVERGVYISDDHTNALVRATYASSYANRWLALRLEAMGNILVFGTTLCAVLSPPGGLSASMIGLVLSYTMQLLGTMTWCVRQFTETESQMNAMERIAEYSEPPFPQEEVGGLGRFLKEQKNAQSTSTLSRSESTGLISEDVVEQLNHGALRKASRWPKRGLIEFENVNMRYREDLPPALRELSFKVHPGEHVGIVGRTGAGKSSAIQSLFRLYELDKGQIKIDGVDISKLRLFDLRSSIGIIPQEPVCFSGTIRSNLDMFGEHEDDAIQRALDACGLQDTMREPVSLDYGIVENGSNLSVGQRQLLCLGRALLKDSQVLVLDEATSNVSNEADEKIQQTLRDEMTHCTILTVAHRLHTVIQNDRIIVMDRGRIAECGRPIELLSRPSMLSDLVDETGPSTAAYLRRLAATPRGQSPPRGNSPSRGKNLTGTENGISGMQIRELDGEKDMECVQERVRLAFKELRAALMEVQTDDVGGEELFGSSDERKWRAQVVKMIGKLTVVSEEAPGVSVECLGAEAQEVFARTG